ncbi:MAG: M14 metallopeptidase family protein, partial [Chitinophagaceae bacterium]
MKKLFLFFLFLVSLSAMAQLKTPDQFLGYPIGSRYTPHWKVVSYFQHAADAMPANVKLQQYGVTNEGRPLLVVFLSNETHIKNLEQIRANNLRLANHSIDKMTPIEDMPPIVWMSYNVHGNETSSSEAAMLTLYTLLDPANAKAKSWLSNTVVVLDPCINPDGRDRYVNWYNGVVGVNANPRMDTREHRDPWPGGRTNHYNFDLNRDWAWQTQVETQQRMKLYNQWMPQIHVDFHEQGINEPYYYAPAAEPFHDVITPWQRSFQNTIGKNHAKYFDANGWLYFTKQRFDLFYPSYGDTYPTYNGAIGMTYEQAGGGGAGAAAINEDGDTLTLHDRVMHHFTTGISTVEIASQHATKLNAEFRKFFNKAVSEGYGEYKTYVVKNTAADAARIRSMLTLLDKNLIQYHTASGTAKGYNYHNGKEEAFTIANGDVVIPAVQPRSALVQVLFEPKSRLSDSATYDITAWALPYAYGLTAYASRDKIAGLSAYPAAVQIVNTNAEAYAYLIRWDGVRSAKAVGDLLQRGMVLRYAELPFEVDGKKYERGTVMVLKTSNQQFGNRLWQHVADACNKAGVTAETVSTGFVDKGTDFGSDMVRPFKAPRVVMLTGEGVGANAAGEIWHFFETQLQYPLHLVYANDIARLDWQKTDVIIMPDGNYRFLNDKNTADQLREWISKGGKMVALENAAASLAKLDWGLKLKKDEGSDPAGYDALKAYEQRERDPISNTTPGAIFRVELDNTHPLAFGYPKHYYTLKQDGVIFEFFKDNGWNVGTLKKDAHLAGFVGNTLKGKLKDGLLIGVQDIVRGNVVYLADEIVFRSFCE